MPRQPNPTPPAKYPSLADLKTIKERLNLAALCREAGVNYDVLKTCFQYEREPPVEVYRPLRKVLLRLSRDLRKACAMEEADATA